MVSYIHHNVIDTSAYQRGGRKGNYREGDWPVWTTIDPFGSHGSGGKAGWWKVYNNTIVARRSGYDWNAAGPTAVTGNPEKYVYNNIFYMLDDRTIFRDDQTSSGSHDNGNVLYRTTASSHPFFNNFGNSTRYPSLAEFRLKSGTNWETTGLEIDPGFNVATITDSAFDPATIWSRYRPTNSQVFTQGASTTGLGWPEADGVHYRGAVPPAP